jgi:hypothetical protein
VSAAAVGLAVGCRSWKNGIVGIEWSKSNRSYCKVCKFHIPRLEARFCYRHSKTKPCWYIHLECVVGCTDPVEELIVDIKALQDDSDPALKQAVSNAWAALQAC